MQKIFSILERRSLAISLIALILGVIITAISAKVGEVVSRGVLSLISVYNYFVPLLIYLLLAPVLGQISDLAKRYGNGWLISVFKQFIVARVLAILFAIIVLSLFFKLGFKMNHGTTLLTALSLAGKQLLETLFYSPLLYGVYASIATALVAKKVKVMGNFLQKISAGIEYSGEFLMILSPLLMFAVGSFLYHLPVYLAENFTINMAGNAVSSSQFLNLNFFGLNYVPPKFAFVALYLLIGLTTGALCLIWHGLFIVYTKLVEPKFSLKYYIKNYWSKVYPLLWSSSSETLALPLSLNLMKKNYPSIPAEVRQFVIVGGSNLGINGTLISVYVMAVFLAKVVGAEVTFLQLLMSLPIVFLLGYAVPGIPGELVIFAGSMSLLLGIPPAAAPLFLALYLTLQIGLPDSFRTGCNSTDSALMAIISSHKLEKYKEKAVMAKGGLAGGKICTEMIPGGNHAVCYKKEEADSLAGNTSLRMNNKI